MGEPWGRVTAVQRIELANHSTDSTSPQVVFPVSNRPPSHQCLQVGSLGQAKDFSKRSPENQFLRVRRNITGFKQGSILT